LLESIYLISLPISDVFIALVEVSIASSLLYQRVSSRNTGPFLCI
jgi:hypothetical protein